MKKPLKWPRKIIKPPAIKQQKIINNAWMTDFPGHRHEDDVHTGKSGASAWLFCRPCCARVEIGVVNRNFILKEEEVWPLMKVGGGGGGNLGTLFGLGNVACNSWLRVGTRFFNCQYCILKGTTVCYNWPNYGGWGWHLRKLMSGRIPDSQWIMKGYVYIHMGHSPENWTKEGATFPMK